MKLLLTIALVLATTATASAETWSKNHKVVRVQPTTQGWVWVTLDRANTARSAENCTSAAVMLRRDKGDEESRNWVYSAILAAYANGDKIDINVYRSPTGHCAIERVSIHK